MRVALMTLRRLLPCGAAVAVLAGAASAAPEMFARLPNEKSAMFAVGRPVPVELGLRGFPPGERYAVEVSVEDAWAHVVASASLTAVTDTQGVWRATYPAPGDRRGFYRLRARADCGLTLPKRGSRPAGCLTYAVTIDPAKRPPLDETQAFAGIHGEVYEGGYIARWLGVRQLMDGQRVMADEATYEREFARRRAMGWVAYGYTALSLLQRTNHPSPFLSEEAVNWRASCGNFWKFFSDPVGQRLYDEAVEKMARAGIRQTYFQKRRLYEALWEPDLSAPSPEAIANALRRTRAALRRGDPEALVMGPTICNVFSKIDYFRRCCEAGALKHVDVFSVHAYNPYPPEPNGFVRNIRAIRDIVRQYGGLDMPMVSTEHGFQAAAVTDEELLQMNGMIRQQLILLGEGFAFAMPFVVRDYGGDFADRLEGDYGLFYNLDLRIPDNRWGAEHHSPRPVAAALAGFSEMVDGYRPTAVLETFGETVLGYAYQNAQGHVVIAVWDWGEDPAEIVLPVGVAQVDVADIMGNVERRSAPEGKVRLKLGPSPVYVRGVSAAAWGRNGFMATRLREEAEREQAAREARRRVEVSEIAPAFVKGAPAVSCLLENRMETNLTVRLAATGGDLKGACAVTLKPRERQRVSVPLAGRAPEPFAVVTMTVVAEPEGGSRAVCKGRLNFLTAPRVAQAVGKGGDFSGWRNARYVDVSQKAIRNAANHKGADDVRAKAAFGWNEDALLVDILVEDDAYFQDCTGWWTWRGDCVQLGFAKRRLDVLTANALADARDQAVSEVSFALTAKGPEACRTRSFDPTRYPCDESGNGRLTPGDCPYRIDRENLAGGRVRLRYRVAYPWRFLERKAPAAGETCLFAAFIADRDPDAPQPACLPIFRLQPAAPEGFGFIYLGD